MRDRGDAAPGQARVEQLVAGVLQPEPAQVEGDGLTLPLARRSASVSLTASLGTDRTATAQGSVNVHVNGREFS